MGVYYLGYVKEALARAINYLVAAVDFDTLADLTADTALTYTTAQAGTVEVGKTVRTRSEGFSYVIAASGATDHHLATAGGIKLYVQPHLGGEYHLAAFGIANDGVTDDYAKFRLAADACRDNDVPNLILPQGHIYCSQEIEIDWYGQIIGKRGHTYVGTESCTSVYFPPGVNGFRFTRSTTSTSGGSANDSTLKDIEVKCIGDNTNSTGHGVVMDARGICRGVSVHQFPEDGFHIVATATDTPSTNANLWTLDRCRSQDNGRDGFLVDGADTNAGEAIGCDAVGNGRINFNDSSFLGNTYIAAHSSAPGRRAYGKGSDGKGYRCILDHVATADTIPVTGASWATYWEEWNTTTSYPTIAAGTKYYESRNGLTGTYPFYHFVADNANAKNAFIGCYEEGATGVLGGGSYIIYPATVIGGEMQSIEPFGSTRAIRPGATPIRAISTFTSDEVTSWLGSDNSSIQSAFGFEHDTPGVMWRLQFNETYGIWELKGNNSGAARTFYINDSGNAQGMPTGLLDFSSMGYGLGGKRVIPGTTEPTTGTWTAGDRVMNTAPSPGGFVGWVCTTGGTPGTWKGFGSIEA